MTRNPFGHRTLSAAGGGMKGMGIALRQLIRQRERQRFAAARAEVSPDLQRWLGEPPTRP
jgi:hypothetical protein